MVKGEAGSQMKGEREVTEVDRTWNAIIVSGTDTLILLYWVLMVYHSDPHDNLAGVPVPTR